jgi:hypothetical protein
MEELHALRRRIDSIDEQIVTLLAERLKLVDNLIKIKRKLKLGIKDEARERAIIARTRRKAREKGLDPSFVESLMRLVIAHSVGVERERMGGVGMWAKIQKVFEDYPAQLDVARVLFKYGLRVREDGKISCGDMKIPSVQIAREARVDRRVVDATVKTILKHRGLRSIFENIEPIAYLKDVAQQLSMGVIEILPKNATRPGIISEVTKVLSEAGISIRQAIADDPYFIAQPKLTIITDEPIKGDVIESIRKIRSVESVIVY